MTRHPRPSRGPDAVSWYGGPPYFWTAHSLYAEISLTAIHWHSSEFQVQDYAWVLLCSSKYCERYCATPECQCYCAPPKYGYIVIQQCTDILCSPKYCGYYCATLECQCYCAPTKYRYTVLPQILRVLLCYSGVPMLLCSNKVWILCSLKLRVILCSPNEGSFCAPRKHCGTDYCYTFIYCTVLLLRANQNIWKGSYYIAHNTSLLYVVLLRTSKFYMYHLHSSGWQVRM